MINNGVRYWAVLALLSLLLLTGCVSEEAVYKSALSDIQADEALGKLSRSTSFEEVISQTHIPGRDTESSPSVISKKAIPVPIKTVDGKTIVTLELIDFIDLAKLNDTTFMAYKESLANSEESLRSTLRSYRPVFGGSISASFNPVSGSDSQSVNFSLSQKLPWSGSLSLSNSGSRSHTTSPPDTESMSFSSALSLSFDILLRPGGYAQWREGLISAQRSWVYAQRSFRQKSESYLINKVSEFFSTINSLKSLKNEEEKLKDAQNRVEVAKFEYNRGRKSLTAVYIAEENLIETEQAINDRREEFEEKTDDLKLMLGIPQEYELELVDEPVHTTIIKIDLAEAVKKALANNPSFQTERDRYEDRRRNFLLSLYNLRIAPRISLSYNTPLLDENSEDIENHNSSYGASISWSFNLDQESRKNSYRQLLQGWTIYERDFKRRQDEIVKEVRRQVRSVLNSQKSLRNSLRSYDTATKKKEGADLDYENNEISAAEFNDAINAVTNAWNALNQARVNYKVECLRYLSMLGEFKMDDRGEWLK